MPSGRKIVELGWKVWDEAAEITVFTRNSAIPLRAKDPGRIWLRVNTRAGETIAKLGASTVAELEARVREMLRNKTNA